MSPGGGDGGQGDAVTSQEGEPAPWAVGATEALWEHPKGTPSEPASHRCSFRTLAFPEGKKPALPCPGSLAGRALRLPRGQKTNAGPGCSPSPHPSQKESLSITQSCVSLTFSSNFYQVCQQMLNHPVCVPQAHGGGAGVRGPGQDRQAPALRQGGRVSRQPLAAQDRDQHPGSLAQGPHSLPLDAESAVKTCLSLGGWPRPWF